MQHANNRPNPPPPNMQLMSEVEQGMIQSSQGPTSLPNSGYSSEEIQQFFQNFPGFPTYATNVQQQQPPMQQTTELTSPIRMNNEQLQLYTSEILRQAILRNRENNPELYHDKNNNYQ